ncbi:MAG: GDP-mannose mannosyl hydrolase [Parcubacteria group bacterium]|nr:GDP-mannose mannosyl hydrolase [Parcubacteria group bacterium]
MWYERAKKETGFCYSVAMVLSDNKLWLSQKTFVFNTEGKFLTLFRTETAPTRPCCWDLPGGVFELGEDPESSARREIREEAGIEVTDMAPLALEGSYTPAQDFVVTVAYRANAVSTDITLSYEHNEYKWVTPAEFLELKSSDKWMQIVRANLL